jgi:hypothetical protein
VCRIGTWRKAIPEGAGTGREGLVEGWFGLGEEVALMDRYPSGRRGRLAKPLGPKGREGSNPSLSVRGAWRRITAGVATCAGPLRQGEADVVFHLGLGGTWPQKAARFFDRTKGVLKP